MARRVGMQEANVRRYVRGTVAAPHDFLVKVADAYGVSIDYLYARDRARPPDDPTMPAWARRLESRIERLEHQLETLMSREQVEEMVAGVEGRVTAAIMDARSAMFEDLSKALDAWIGEQPARSRRPPVARAGDQGVERLGESPGSRRRGP